MTPLIASILWMAGYLNWVHLASRVALADQEPHDIAFVVGVSSIITSPIWMTTLPVGMGML